MGECPSQSSTLSYTNVSGNLEGLALILARQEFHLYEQPDRRIAHPSQLPFPLCEKHDLLKKQAQYQKQAQPLSFF